MKRLGLLLFIMYTMSLVVSGCGNDPPPMESSTDTETEDVNYDDNIVEGGGTTGGPIDGLLVIWFINGSTGNPIPGTLVQVGNDSETGLTATADDDGRVVFEDESLDGSVDFHYMTSGFTTSSIYGFNATYITIEIYPEDYVPDAPDTVEISGSVAGFDLVPDPGSIYEMQFAFVGYGLSLDDIYSGEYEDLEQPETEDLPTNMIVVGMQDTFTLETHNRKGTLYALAGLLTFVGEDDVTMEITHIGYVMGLDPATDDTQDVEITLTDALDESISVEVTPFPDEYEEKNAMLIVDLGVDGSLSFSGFVPAQTEDVVLQVPDLGAAPYDGKDTLMMMFAGPGGDADYPTGMRLVHDVVGELGGGDSMLIDDLLPPPRDLTWNGEKLAFTLTGEVDFTGFSFESNSGSKLWDVTIANPTFSELSVPTLPEGWGFDGIPESGFQVDAEAFSLNADLNDVAFNDLYEIVISVGETLLIVE